MLADFWQGYSRAQRILFCLIAAYFGTLLLFDLPDGVIQAVLGIWSLVILFMPSIRGRADTAMYALLIVVLIYIGAELVSYWVNEPSKDGFRQIRRHLQRLLLLVPLYFLLRRFARPEMLWCGVVFGCVVTGLWAIAESLQFIPETAEYPDPGRANGAVNPIFFGDLSLMMAVLSAVALPWAWPRGLYWRLAVVTAVTLGLVAMTLSGTRGALLFVPAAFAVVLWAYTKSGILGRKSILLLAIVVPAAFLVLAVTTPMKERIQSAWQAYTFYQQTQIVGGEPGAKHIEHSVGARIEMTKTALAIFADKPVFGVGPGRYRDAAMALAEQGAGSETAAILKHPHSEYLGALCMLGLTGFMATLLLMVFPLLIGLQPILRSRNEEKIQLGFAGVALGLGLMHFGLTTNMFDRTVFLSFYGLTTTLLLALIFRPDNEESVAAIDNHRD